MPEKPSNWTVNFTFNTPILAIRLENQNQIRNVIFNMEPGKLDAAGTPGIKLNGFQIFVPNTTEQGARSTAEEKANIIFNYLSTLYQHPYRGSLTNMANDKGQGSSTYTMGLSGLIKPQVIDIADINSVINKHDDLYLRQLSHYTRGLEAEDIVTKYREFYQVLEDEQSKNKLTPPPSLLTTINQDDILRIVRHLASHPRLTDKKSVAIANQIAGKNSLDLYDSKDLSLITQYLKIVQVEAKKILKI